ncbi:MAG: 50S ribosomal protein L30 [Epulopiscium sp. Nele67-Bin001]|nr:MAG: 50S ribosomal protein L30 [Epulopiscium sp. Nuni2H_MBin001]OON90625.1 MAG: 50S ribosomal protein L30 [Epulopiscium sp. Nele67-Bin001]
MANIKVTLVRSTIGAIPKHKKTIQALGLRKINSSKVHQDNAAIRGMVSKVTHLVKVEEV